MKISGIASFAFCLGRKSSRTWTPNRIVRACSVVIVIALLSPSAIGVQERHQNRWSAIIRRDNYGVPHIVGQSEQAAAYAFGYASAEDHLLEMGRLFLRAQGQQASVFGEAYVQDDLLVHRLRIWETAHDRFARLPALMQGILNNYALGYNAYLQQERRRNVTPEWMKPITGVDVLAHCRAVLLLDFALNLAPWHADKEKMPGFGSNMWAVGSPKSVSGRGMLLANPHLRWSGSHKFYEAQITVPGVVNIYGATLLGFPVIVIGFNEYLGWTHTVNQIHAETIYDLDLNPANRAEYYDNGRKLRLRAIPVSIQVLSSGKESTVHDLQLYSRFGPLIRTTGNKAYAYNSSNLDDVDFLTEYNRMAKARSLSEFRKVLSMGDLAMFNIGYADRNGNVFYLYNGRIPVRPPGSNWRVPISGNKHNKEWFETIPITGLPQATNPPEGYIQNCNDAPWYVARGAPIRRLQYPQYDGDENLGLRGQESLRLLESTKKLTLADLLKDKYDEHLLLADRVKSELIQLAERTGEPNLLDASNILKSWNNDASAESKGALLFSVWWDNYRGLASEPFATPWSPDDPYETPRGLGNNDVALAALRTATKWMIEHYGKLDEEWGEVHRLRSGAFDLPVGGSSGFGSLRTIIYKQDQDGKWVGIAGDSFTMAVEFTDPPTAYSVMEYSESSDPKSKHYDDQLSLFAKERYKRVWFSEQEINAHTEAEYEPPQLDSPLPTDR